MRSIVIALLFGLAACSGGSGETFGLGTRVQVNGLTFPSGLGFGVKAGSTRDTAAAP